MRNPMRHRTRQGAMVRKGKPSRYGKGRHSELFRSVADLFPCQIPPRGLEQGDVSDASDKQLQNVSESGGAVSGAVSAKTVQLDADLACVVDAWPGLSDAVKQAILSMVEAAGGADQD
jgi:hypothetical protein